MCDVHGPIKDKLVKGSELPGGLIMTLSNYLSKGITSIRLIKPMIPMTGDQLNI